MAKNDQRNTEIILTVQSSGKNGIYKRLGASVHDSKEIFECRGRLVEFHVCEDEIIHTKAACGVKCWNDKLDKKQRKKSYDFNRTHQWLMKCGFNENRTKLKFKTNRRGKTIKLEFICKISN